MKLNMGGVCGLVRKGAQILPRSSSPLSMFTGQILSQSPLYIIATVSDVTDRRHFFDSAYLLPLYRSLNFSLSLVISSLSLPFPSPPSFVDIVCFSSYSHKPNVDTCKHCLSLRCTYMLDYTHSTMIRKISWALTVALCWLVD